MNSSYANYLLKKTVDDYNRIAELFSNTRENITQDLTDLGIYTKDGDRVLDYGCGNGRFFGVISKKNPKYLGLDVSQNLINIAKSKYPSATFKKIKPNSEIYQEDNKFDIVYCLAVFHHVPGLEMRKRFLDEIYRVLQKGGKFILTVWDLDFNEEIKRSLLKQEAKRFFNLFKTDKGDIFYPFKDSNKKILANRYLHSFTKAELESEVINSGFKIIESRNQNRGSQVKNRNILVVSEK